MVKGEMDGRQRSSVITVIQRDMKGVSIMREEDAVGNRVRDER